MDGEDRRLDDSMTKRLFRSTLTASSGRNASRSDARSRRKAKGCSVAKTCHHPCLASPNFQGILRALFPLVVHSWRLRVRIVRNNEADEVSMDMGEGGFRRSRNLALPDCVSRSRSIISGIHRQSLCFHSRPMSSRGLPQKDIN